MEQQLQLTSTELAVDDKKYHIASGSANKAAADGAGITVDLGTDGTTGLTPFLIQ